MPARVYKYGIGKNIEWPEKRLPDEVFEQLRLQNRFWNALVEIEKTYSDKYDEIRSNADARLGVLKDQIDHLLENLTEMQAAIKKERQKARRAVPIDSATKIRIADTKMQLYELKQERKALRDEIKERIRPQADAMNLERQSIINEKRREFAAKGLYWGNYNAVLESMELARKLVFRKRSQGEPADFKFRPFTGEGRLTVQLMKGPTFEEILKGTSRQLQLDPVPSEAWESPVRAVRKKHARTTGRIRVTSDNYPDTGGPGL